MLVLDFSVIYFLLSSHLEFVIDVFSFAEGGEHSPVH